MNGYEECRESSKSRYISLDAKDKKAIEAAVSWKNPEAQAVIKKLHKAKADPIYGLFEGVENMRAKRSNTKPIVIYAILRTSHLTLAAASMKSTKPTSKKKCNRMCLMHGSMPARRTIKTSKSASWVMKFRSTAISNINHRAIWRKLMPILMQSVQKS
jgi:hypothetical protein